MLLPLNSKLLHDLRTFQAETHREPDWTELFDPSSTFKLLYALQIVEAEIDPLENEKVCIIYYITLYYFLLSTEL
jgi:hypothetical protein